MPTTTHERKSIPPERLCFDIHNPRLVAESFSDNPDDYQVIQHLCETSDIAELVISILRNTFVDFEPLVVTKSSEEQYRVLEGNRRLAAIKLLLDPQLSEKLESALQYHIDRPLTQEVDESLQTISVIVVPDEQEAQAYIGFKHINGPHKWTSYAKARFVTKWFKQGVEIEEIAKKVGDKNQTVKDLIAGMLVLEQAENEELFDISDRTKRGVFGFSHLYTALNRKEYRHFLGLDKNWTDSLSENPIDSEHLENLETTLKFMYGSKKDNIESVIRSQNPNLRELGVVLNHPIARQKLLDTNNLSIALEETESKTSVFEKSLIQGHTHLRKAAGVISAYNGSEYLLETAREMEKMLKHIIDGMETIASDR